MTKIPLRGDVTQDWTKWDWEWTPEASTELLCRLADVVDAWAKARKKRGHAQTLGRKEDHWFWERVLISEKDTVVRVYLDEKLVFTEFEDRFPSPENVAKLRLLAL